MGQHGVVEGGHAGEARPGHGAGGVGRRRAVVTGASRGIGRALALDLAQRGWAVGALARDAGALASLNRDSPGHPAGEAAPAGAPAPAGSEGEVRAVVADVTDGAAVREAVAALTAIHGVPDLVVANAGVLQAVGPTWQVDPALWWRELEVNLLGVFNTLHATLPAMVARGSGRVVVMSSGLGQKPSPWSSAYGAGKAAVTHLVSSLSGELEGTGVSAFAISPGMVRTDMTDWPEGLLAHRPDLAALPSGAFVPIGAVVDLVADLASGAYDLLRGEFIHVRDDRVALLAAAIVRRGR